jgi:hypothetical protein
VVSVRVLDWGAGLMRVASPVSSAESWFVGTRESWRHAPGGLWESVLVF